MIGFLVILLVAVLVVTPCVMTLCNNAGFRQTLSRAGLAQWSVWWDRFFDSNDHSSAYPPPETASTVCFAPVLTTREHRPQSKTLELTAWQEHVRRQNADVHTPLDRIEIKTEPIDRGDVSIRSEEPPVSTASHEHII